MPRILIALLIVVIPLHTYTLTPNKKDILHRCRDQKCSPKIKERDKAATYAAFLISGSKKILTFTTN